MTDTIILFIFDAILAISKKHVNNLNKLWVCATLIDANVSDGTIPMKEQY